MISSRNIVILAFFISFLAACAKETPMIPSSSIPASPIANLITPTITPSISSTVTRKPIPSTTPTPTITPSPTYLSITPVLQGTHLPEFGIPISVGNTDRLTLFAHWGQGNPNGLAFTPDGKYFVVGTSIGLYFYDPDGLSFSKYIDTQAAVSDLAISPDSQTLAAVTTSQVLLYNISDWQLTNSIPIDANSVDFSPDGKTLALGINSDPGCLQLHDASSGEVLNTFKNEQAAWAVKISPRGDFIATGGYSTTVWGLDGTVTDQYGPYVSGGHTASVSFSPDGEFLAEGSDYFLKIWRVLENGRLIIYRDIDLSRFYDAFVYNVAISPNAKFVAVTLSKGVYVWDLASGSRVFGAATDYSYYNSLAWSMDSKTIAAASRKAGVQLWNITTGDKVASLITPSGDFTALVWSPDGMLLAAGVEQGTVFLFDAQLGAVIQSFGSGYFLNSLAFSPDSQSLAVGYDDRVVDIWNLDGTIAQTLTGFGYGSSDATFSADGSLFAASLPESWQTPPQVRFWNTLKWDVEKTFSIGNNNDFMITGFTLAPDQSTGAISYVDMTGYHKDMIQIVSIADQAVLGYLEPGSKQYRVFIESIAYSPDGTFLAALVSEFFDPNPRILVWQTSDWHLLYGQTIIMDGQRLGSAIYQQDAMAWSPDSTLLAVGMLDGSIRILEAHRGKELFALTGHRLAVAGVAFSPDGRILASSSYDGTVMLWGVR